MNEPVQHLINLDVFVEMDRDGHSKFVCQDEKGNIKRGTIDELVEFIILAREVFALNIFEVAVMSLNLDHVRKITIHTTPTGNVSYYERPLSESEAFYLQGELTKPLTEK